MSKKYFGTDGIRGRVGDDFFTPEFVLKLGWAAGCVLAREGRKGVLICKDTRISGYMFESALESGLSAAGVNIRLLGPMPTPGIAYLTRTLHAGAGIVISASHNPYSDNGIKFFSGSGEKLSDELELAIERELGKPMQTVDSASLGKAERVVDAAGRYIEFCKSTTPSTLSLGGLSIVVDCANGATYHVAPSVFDELGARVTKIAVQPDGLNINHECGSTYPARLQQTVLEVGADIGIALDGDGDRLIMVDHRGEVVDGDELLYIIARSRQRTGQMRGSVVGTVMSNFGLEHAIRSLGLGFERAPVGDRYVLQKLQENGWILGGESSGHIICLDRTTTGDGIVAALQVLTEMVQTGASLHDLKQGMEKYPQYLINVRVAGKVNLAGSDVVQAALRQAEAALAGKGRVLLRTSGTEPLVRVMVEGSDIQKVKHTAGRLADQVADTFSGQVLQAGH
ncbi:MAG: phosphoglucosamine mutase [Gammaproteobacteria bacterium RBG_16_57_12]|nr:MAG: phosphoglucosamine mutase [Gammaproteobacteria bacterium RBG_16_57_12]